MMVRESDQLLRDVIIAGDAREQNRRRGEDDNSKTRTEKLEAESNTGKERFDEIAKRCDDTIICIVELYVNQGYRNTVDSA